MAKKKSSDWLRQGVCFLNFQIKNKLKILNDHDQLVTIKISRFGSVRCFYQVWLYFDSWRFFAIFVLVAKKRVRERKEKKRKKRKRKKKNVRMIHIRSTSCWFKTTKKRRGFLKSKLKQNIEYGILTYYPITVVIEGWFTFAFPLAFPRILICICAQEGRHLLSKNLVICVPIY